MTGGGVVKSAFREIDAQVKTEKGYRDDMDMFIMGRSH